MSQARFAWGACIALFAFPPSVGFAGAGCGMVSLDGLTGGDGGVGTTGGDGGLGSGVHDEAAAHESGASPDAANVGDAVPPETTWPPQDAGDAAQGAVDAPTGLGADAADGGVAPAPDAAPPPIGFVQIAVSTSTAMASSVSVTLGQAQAAGDLVVVAIGWNDATGTIASVGDSSGNAYALAVGPTRYGSDLTQAIYYAKNVAAAPAGSNAVKVRFVQAVNMPDLRVLEYSGLDPVAPLDQTAAATGKGVGAVSTPAVGVATGGELLFAAGMTTDIYSAGGPGYAVRVVTNNGDLAEDRVIDASGSYAGDAVMGSVTAGWIMQLATFR